MAEHKSNPPKADFLMGAMRSMGYSFEAAIADILDNSISANAKNIHIEFPNEPYNCFVSFLDDGIGMDDESLFKAMKYGSNSSEDQRSEHDLGRFGLGMKAASLSQCKLLTVVSKQNGIISAYQWDYDLILKKKEWLVVKLNDQEITQLIGVKKLKTYNSGTLVIWQNFDVLEKSSGDTFTALKEYKSRIIDYLSLIFHRFINDESSRKINITVNNCEIAGLDPFLEKHKKTNHRQEFTLTIKDKQGIERYISVQPYVLPFQKDLSESDIKLLGGIANLRTKQGFYIYRNRRLIIWGTWFGLPRNELTKHARIRVDIPNTLDDIWNIDIKKQNASIPKTIKNSLTNAVQEAMDLSVKVQSYRGRIEKIDEEFDYVWNRIEVREKKFVYSINRESRIFGLLKENVDDTAMGYFEMILEEIERNIPFQQIYIDISQDIVDETDDEARLKDVVSKGIMWVKNVVDFGELSAKQSIDLLFKSEPFCKHTELKQKFYNHFEI